MRPGISATVPKPLIDSPLTRDDPASADQAASRKSIFLLGFDDEEGASPPLLSRSPRPRAATLGLPAPASPSRVGSPMRLPSADRLADVYDPLNRRQCATPFGGIAEQKRSNWRDIDHLLQVRAVRMWSPQAHVAEANDILFRLSEAATRGSLTAQQKVKILSELSVERIYPPILESVRPVVSRMLRAYLQPIPLLLAESREWAQLPANHACAHADVSFWQLTMFGGETVGITSPLDLCGKTQVGFAFSRRLGLCFFKQLRTPLERLYREDEQQAPHLSGLAEMLPSILAGLELPTQSQPKAVIFERGQLLVLHAAGHGSLASLAEVLPRFSRHERLHLLEHVALSALEQLSTISDCRTAYGITRPETLGWDAEGRIYLTHQSSRAAYESPPQPPNELLLFEAKQFFKEFVELDKRPDVATYLAPERLFMAQSRCLRQTARPSRWALPPAAPARISDDLWALGVVLRELWLAGERLRSQSLTLPGSLGLRREMLLGFADWHDAVALNLFPNALADEPTLSLGRWGHHTQELAGMLKQRRGLAYAIHQLFNHPNPAMRSDGFAALDEMSARLAAPHPDDVRLPGNSVGALTRLRRLDIGQPSESAAATAGSQAPRPRPWSQSAAALFARAAAMVDPWQRWRDALQRVAEGAPSSV